ncbi:MAG TPA: hypothetical protein VM781_02315 [Candidatus Bathyarchaeia archaeon]|nr:hypothetical protein [Candidatus Bathyarchaeia archaeon]
MLLPLRGIPRESWLRENVRNEKVRLALVGDDLREATNQTA